MLNYKEHLEQCCSDQEREIIIDTSKEINFDLKSVNSSKYAQSEYSVTTAKTKMNSKIQSKQVLNESLQAFKEYNFILKCPKCKAYLYGPKTCSKCKETFCDDCVQKKKDSCPNSICKGKEYQKELKIASTVILTS